MDRVLELQNYSSAELDSLFTMEISYFRIVEMETKFEETVSMVSA